ncbi:unnamed protein product [Urochloa decumbens]|uniref:Reverse transcriptase zinc-binding domain-containing protein n=1 Tax=Urochloa decumbens TaxID=240449 RepID=A0ABC8WKC8_9POAL
MRGLRRISSEVALRQFVTLWNQVAPIQLSQQPDNITWRFSPDGEYTAQSAYKVQFIGSIREPRWKKIWKVKVEQKCRFFIWLLLQLRLPTADRILRRGGQANPVCQLCHTTPESTLHMMDQCSYSTAVWQKMAQWTQFQLPQGNSMTMRAWWNRLVRAGAQPNAQHLQVIIYTAWNLCKERCRRVFQNKAMNIDQLESTTRNDIVMYREATLIVE